jgi:protocatechuate 3,4-dioxygenase beta subunit
MTLASAIVTTAMMGAAGGADAVAGPAQDAAVIVGRKEAKPASDGRIVGRVTDSATGRPVAGAAVAAQLIERPARSRTDGWGQAVTDDQGWFRIDRLEPGVFNLILLEVPGRKHATATAAEGVRVEAGTEATADLAVIEGRPLRGVVVDLGDDGKPLRGARVGCQGPPQPQSGQALMATETDDRGRFAFHVPPGEHFVFVIDDPARNRTGRRLVTVPEEGENLPVYLLISAGEAAAHTPAAPEVAAAEEEAVVVDAPLRAAAIGAEKPAEKVRTVKGRVTDPAGRPLTGIHVGVANGSKRRVPGMAVRVRSDPAITDREGTFLLSGLTPRKISITLSRPFDQPLVVSLPADGDEATFTYRPQPDERARRAFAPVQNEPVPQDLRGRLTFVDLTPYGTNFLANGPGEQNDDGNNLDYVPRGVHKLRDTYFRIGDRMVHVRGTNKMGMPVSVAGIKVAARGEKVHFLHGNQQKTDPGTRLGDYVIRYADRSTERVPITFGRNLIDWWDTGVRKEDLPGARIAWRGSNEMLDKRPNREIQIGLWDFTWTNPHPEKEIAAIDVVSSTASCDPFLVAVTLEREK